MHELLEMLGQQSERSKVKSWKGKKNNADESDSVNDELGNQNGTCEYVLEKYRMCMCMRVCVMVKEWERAVECSQILVIMEMSWRENNRRYDDFRFGF